jgi:cell division protein ZapA
MLDAEAQTLSAQIGRMPPEKMLLMSGLLLADKTAAVEDKVKTVQGKLAQLQAELDALKAQGTPVPERIEVPVVPSQVTDAMAEIAARAEALAADVEAKLS